ncbi:hypothetical protein ACHQM5_013224 [Ranunculus cassubicifolius]
MRDYARCSKVASSKSKDVSHSIAPRVLFVKKMVKTYGTMLPRLDFEVLIWNQTLSMQIYRKNILYMSVLVKESDLLLP